VKAVTVSTIPRTIHHQSPSREDKTRSVPRDTGDSALSIRPRPSLDPAPTLDLARRTVWPGTLGHFTLLSRTASGYPGMAGHPEATSLQSTQQESTKHRLKPPLDLATSRPIKRQARANQGEGKREKKNTKHHGKNAKQPSFSFFSLRLGARHPLSPACNPYTSTPVQGNTNLSSPLDVGPSFARTRINPRVFSLHHHPGKSHAAFTRWFRTPLGPNTDSWRAR
jgi:hypothetical protein